MVSAHSVILSLALSTFFSSIWATPIRRISKRDSPIRVSLTRTDSNALIEAHLSNTGTEPISILRLGSILSDSPIRQVDVTTASGSPLPFMGIYEQYHTASLTAEDYITIPPGGSINTTVPLAKLYDLSAADKYRISAAGLLKTAVLDTEVQANRIDGASEATPTIDSYLEFEAEPLELTVDRRLAKRDHDAFHASLGKRLVINQCSGTQNLQLQYAMSRTIDRARAAAQDAASGTTGWFQEFFKTTDSESRQLVAKRLNAAADTVSTINTGTVKYYCNDVFQQCSRGVLAWTMPSRNTIANCDLYYEVLSQENQRCGGQDQWTTTLHELVHAPAVAQPPAEDLGYGYNAAARLSTNSALQNADTYALYAQAVHLDCGIGEARRPGVKH